MPRQPEYLVAMHLLAAFDVEATLMGTHVASSNYPRRVGRESLLWTTLIIRKTLNQRGPNRTPIGVPFAC